MPSEAAAWLSCGLDFRQGGEEEPQGQDQRPVTGQIDTVALEQAVKQILVDNGHGEDALLKDPSKTACKV